MRLNHTNCYISPTLETINKQFTLVRFCRSCIRQSKILNDNYRSTDNPEYNRYILRSDFVGKAGQNRGTKFKKTTIRFAGTFSQYSPFSLLENYKHFIRFCRTTDEVRHERTYFKQISDHKEIMRTLQSFSSGLLLTDPKISKLLRKMYDEHCYLWSDDMESSLKEFVNNNPLAADVREKFKSYDQITHQLRKAQRTESIDSIVVQMDEAYDDFIEYSKNWKVCLGQLLRALYKKKLSQSVVFIEDVESVLQRPLNDLDDVGIAMDCLQRVRENSIE